MARKVVLVDYLVYGLPLSVRHGGAKIFLGEHHPKVSWCFFFHDYNWIFCMGSSNSSKSESKANCLMISEMFSIVN